MRILIIEDEHYAAKRIQKLIAEELPEANVLSVIDSVEDAVEWLSSHVEPHLIFMDIQLADGLSFQIFDHVSISCPIIFTTAYDEYALNAFKVNSIDYLLKPVENEAFRRAINKYHHHYKNSTRSELNWKSISQDFLEPKEKYKRRFLIKSGSAFAYLQVENIKFFYSEDGLSFAVSDQQKKSIIDKSLDNITEGLNPEQFFRISRKHIVALGEH